MERRRCAANRAHRVRRQQRRPRPAPIGSAQRRGGLHVQRPRTTPAEHGRAGADNNAGEKDIATPSLKPWRCQPLPKAGLGASLALLLGAWLLWHTLLGAGLIGYGYGVFLGHHA